ncbi:MAG: ATP-binding cassette domain-containing protein [Sphingopyxis sp.]|uniref:ATP-binding cassette domain-containing protein n=1 Tax=Sphingopyxis sp. TaxID=1908224 RepID=UPI002AB8C361|nr:ATP-binding cassette domain-containing protein [Sphingopyxis sp.]MDZ3833692.1 ATP-binding cassette domain-containing protein [Sphingopyxis sp.]
MSHPLFHPADEERLSARSGIRAALALVIGQSVAISVLVVTLAALVWLMLDSTLPARSTASLVALALFTWLLIAASLVLGHARKQVINRMVALKVMTDAAEDSSQSTNLLALQSPTTAAVALADTAQLPLLVITAALIHPLVGASLMAALAAAGVAIHWQSRRVASTPAPRETPPAGPERRVVEAAGPEAAAIGLTARWRERWARETLASIERHRQSMADCDRAEILLGLLTTALLLTIALVPLLSAASGQTTIGALGALLLVSSCMVRIAANLRRSVASLPRRGWWTSAGSSGSGTVHAARFTAPSLTLPLPKWGIALESLSLHYDGAAQPAICAIDCALSAGSVTAVMGPAGSGKTSLLRAMTGVWPGIEGDIRLDDAGFRQFDPRRLAERIGYVGEDALLFAGSISDNISGFDAAIPDARIIAAAQTAGMHEAILRLPGGYAEPIGEGGEGLSAASRRGIAVARAVVREPFLLLIDDPFLRLDPAGAQVMEAVIARARARGAVVVIASNDQRAVELADMLMVLRLGSVADFGPRSLVWARARASQSRLGDSDGPRAGGAATPIAKGEVA